MASETTAGIPPINEQMIPERVLVDTGVMIRALESSHWTPDNQRGLDCREFWEAALSRRSRRLLVAAPSVTELLLKPPGTDLPRHRQVEPVSFDFVAAQVLARYVPQAVIQSKKGSFTKDAIRYDALIVACAKRHNASAVVSLDNLLMRDLCEQFQIAFLTPADLRVTLPPTGTPTQGTLSGMG
jgi:hypothetical protein